jgi:hypothetical protein
VRLRQAWDWSDPRLLRAAMGRAQGPDVTRHCDAVCLFNHSFNPNAGLRLSAPVDGAYGLRVRTLLHPPSVAS